MNRDHITIFLIALALLVGIIRYTDPLRVYFLDGLNGIKTTYLDVVTSIDETINEHFDQKKRIAKLTKDNQQYKKDHLILQSVASEFNALLHANQSKLKLNYTKIRYAKAISYVRFGDRNKIWLNFNDFNKSKMYGLVYNGKSAGIVIEKLNRAQALLNGDSKCSYAVYIGDKKAPGIARGKNSNEMVVEFIPTWMKLKVGDKVKTSGLDQLFYEGIPVGIVQSFTQSQGFQVAIIKPYINTVNPGYFHVIDQNFQPSLKAKK